MLLLLLLLHSGERHLSQHPIPTRNLPGSLLWVLGRGTEGGTRGLDISLPLHGE